MGDKTSTVLYGVPPSVFVSSDLIKGSNLTHHILSPPSKAQQDMTESTTTEHETEQTDNHHTEGATNGATQQDSQQDHQPQGQYDVVIVGAGPSGLTLAADLARRGVRFCVLDKDDREMPIRGVCCHARTLELFESLGVVDEMMAKGMEITGERLFVDGSVALDWSYDRVDSPYPFPFLVPQCDIETILASKIPPQDIIRPVRVDAISIGTLPDEGVGVTLTPLRSSTKGKGKDRQRAKGEDGENGAPTEVGGDEGGQRIERRDDALVPSGPSRTITAKYIVGADGAQSVVRKAMGVGFHGTTLPFELIDCDVRMQWGVPREKTRTKFNLLTAEGRMVLGVALSDDRWRLVTTRPLPTSNPYELLDPAYRPLPFTKEELEKAVCQAVPGTEIYEIMWGDAFSINSRVAESFQLGNGFLCGDAAHLSPPIAYQGLNVGVQDAMNLSWKLARVVRGTAYSSLLETYQAERKPIDEIIVRNTSRGYKELVEAKPQGLTHWLLKNVLPRIFGLKSVGRHLSKAISMTSQKYPHSETHMTLTGPAMMPKAVEPGSRAPDARIGLLRENRVSFQGRLHQLYASPHFTLLLTARIPDPKPPSNNGLICGCCDICMDGANMYSGTYPQAADSAMGRCLLQMVRLADDVVRRLGCPKSEPKGGARVIVVFTAGKPAIVPTNASGEGLAEVLKDVKAKFQVSIGCRCPTFDLEVGWDMDGEVMDKYRVPLKPKTHPGAWFFIRPDGYISHHGFAGDHVAERHLTDCLTHYF